MPFGIRSAAATFQRALDIILSGVRWRSCLIYFDDVIVFSRTTNADLRHVYEILTLIRRARITLKLTKFSFFQSKVTNSDMRLPVESSRSLRKLLNRLRTLRSLVILRNYARSSERPTYIVISLRVTRESHGHWTRCYGKTPTRLGLEYERRPGIHRNVETVTLYVPDTRSPRNRIVRTWSKRMRLRISSGQHCYSDKTKKSRTSGHRLDIGRKRWLISNETTRRQNANATRWYGRLQRYGATSKDWNSRYIRTTTHYHG